jgi:M6 family metalloprotease-like protein
MKQSLLFAIVALIVGVAVHANSAPLWNYPQKLTQPDGIFIHCFASGDEFHHWLHDKDNYTIIQNPLTGYFVYALSDNGKLIPSDYIVGSTDPNSVGLTKGVHASLAVALQRRTDFNAMVTGARGKPSNIGILNNLVIFIRFADESQDIYADSIALYDRMFNASSTGANSMYNYYIEVSYGQLAVSSTFYPIATGMVLSYQDAQVRNYYRPYNVVTNPIGYTDDSDARVREQVMLKNAVYAVASQIPPGLNVDANGDGYVDNVCFVVSGDVDGWAYQLWPHMDWLNLLSVSINGKRVRGYDFQLRDFLMLATRGVCTLCHEMFHSLGAPDLYNYAKHLQPDELFPVWIWDVMGCKNQPNPMVNPPQHMGTYMKYKYGGWIASIPAISAPGTYTLSPLLSSTSNCYAIPSRNSSTEYFVVEYRKRSGTFESSLPGEGLLVYRINASLTGNEAGPPDEVYVYRPGGTLTANGTPDSAAFSANSGRTSITDATSPSSFLSTGLPGGLRITNVGSIGETISFTLEPAISVGDESTDLPKTFSLAQNYPNPFNPSTIIKYELPTTSNIRLSVCDLLGREVTVLLNERREAGAHEVKFDASALSSGMYFYRLQAGEFVQTRKLLLVR